MKLNSFSWLLLGGVVACFGWTTDAAKLPADIEKCGYEKLSCISMSINYVLGKYYQGIPEASLTSLDPISVDKVNIIQGDQSPVNIQLELTNAKVYGLRSARVIEVEGFSQQFEGKVNIIRAQVPQLQIASDYTIGGRVLLLPIQGEGRSNLTLSGIRVVMKIIGSKVVHKGKPYFQVDKLTASVEPKQMFLHFENLYRGDKRLGESTNQFLNENWADIYRELRPSIEDTIAQVLKGIIGNFFAKTTYEKLFTE